MAQFDVVIRGGIVVDGTGRGRYRADIGINDGLIAEIGRIPDHEADEVLDAERHDRGAGVHRPAHALRRAAVLGSVLLACRGGTASRRVVIGNCGFGFAPVQPDFRERAMLTMVRTEAIPLESMQPACRGTGSPSPSSSTSVDRTAKAVNMRPFLPMNPVHDRSDGLRAGQGRRAADRRRARRDAPHPARSDGRGRRRLVGAAAASPNRAPTCNATSTAPRWPPT